MSWGNIQRDRIDPSIHGAWSSISLTDHAILLEASSSHYSIASWLLSSSYSIIMPLHPLLSLDALVSITRYDHLGV
jgi:hypothetical protein